MGLSLKPSSDWSQRRVGGNYDDDWAGCVKYKHHLSDKATVANFAPSAIF